MRLVIIAAIWLVYHVWIVHGLTYRGADFSSVINLENGGLVYKDANSTSGAKLETILKNHGANLARVRIWTSTSDSQYSLNYGLKLAKRAAAAGMTLLIDLHYSDTWADPGHQSIPSSWPKDLDGLNSKIYTYTSDLVKAFASQGTPIQYIQIGNEVNNGMLWPIGRTSNGFDSLSQLLHSAASGVRAASSSTKIMVHIADGWSSSGVNNFFNQVFRPGQLSTSDVDILGFSFYPFYNKGATLSSLQTSMQNIINKYGKDIMIVETDWPVSCSGTSLSDSSIAISAAGQSAWVAKIRDIIKALPGGHGTGIVYWEPGWVGNANLGSGCADNLLVESSGQTRSSISMFSNSM